MDAAKVVIAGGSGYVGRALTRALTSAGHDVVVLSRRPPAEVRGLPPGASPGRWDPAGPAAGWAGALEGAGAVVNLAGANIGSRPWTAARRRDILESRLRATSALVAALAELPGGSRPALVSASGVDYYGERGDEPLDEQSPPGGSAFLAEVCQQWEAGAREAEALGVRVVRVRTGLVLSADALALKLMALPFRLFAGGPIGSGRQWVSWVHLDDLVGLYRLAVEDATLSGPLNAAAPAPVRNRELAEEIGRVLHRPSWLPAPAPLLKLPMGRMAQLLLVGHRVEPKVALARGYEFRYPELRLALEDALGRRA